MKYIPGIDPDILRMIRGGIKIEYVETKIIKSRLMVVPANKILHVVLANKPRMLREMLGRLITRSNRVKVIGEETNVRRLPLIVDLFHPDWIVLNLLPNGALPGFVKAIQDKHPDIGILAITENAVQVCALRGNVTREGLNLKDLVSLAVSQSAVFNEKAVSFNNHNN